MKYISNMMNIGCIIMKSTLYQNESGHVLSYWHPPPFSLLCALVNMEYNTGSKLAYVNINKYKKLQWMTYEFK